jgi:hypothetical protein
LISFSDKVSFKIISDPELPGSGMIFQGPDPAISFGTGSTTLYLTKGSGSGRPENLRIRSGPETLMKTAEHRKYRIQEYRKAIDRGINNIQNQQDCTSNFYVVFEKYGL